MTLRLTKNSIVVAGFNTTICNFVVTHFGPCCTYRLRLTVHVLYNVLVRYLRDTNAKKCICSKCKRVEQSWSN